MYCIKIIYEKAISLIYNTNNFSKVKNTYSHQMGLLKWYIQLKSKNILLLENKNYAYYSLL